MMRVLNNFASTTVLVCLMSVVSVMKADILSDYECIRCLCQVSSNSPNCEVNEGCARDSQTPNIHRHSHNSHASVIIHRTNTGRTMQRGGSHSVKPNTNGNNRNTVPHALKRPKRSCGPFSLDIHYYISCGRQERHRGDGDIAAFQRCATNVNCAKSCIQNYTKTFETNCPGPPTCETWSRIHFGYFMGLSNGSGCQSPLTLTMWNDMQQCLLGKPEPTKPVKNSTNSNLLTKFRAKTSRLHNPSIHTNVPITYNSPRNRSTTMQTMSVLSANFQEPVGINRSGMFGHRIDRPHIEKVTGPSPKPIVPNVHLPNPGGIRTDGSRDSNKTDDIHSFRLNN